MANLDFDLESTISDAANSVGLSPSLLASLLKQESNFNPRAVSSAGAIGIAQFMPATAREMGIDPTDPVQSIYGAAQYLRKNVDMFDGDIAAGLAAYNAGPGRVAAAIKRGGDNWHQLLPSETRDYIPSILGRVGEDDFSVGSSSMPQSRFEPKLEDWADRLGLMGDAAQERQKPAETGRNAFAYANDTAIDIANSAAGMAKAGVDLFDPTSRASQAIGDFIKQGRESQSDWKKQQEANLQQELASADGEWDKAGKYIKHKVANDPLGLAAEVVGNAAPFVFTGGALGALSAGARTAASMGLASGLTAGEVRGNIFEKINGTTDEQLIRESPEYRSLRERMGEKEAKEIVGASIIGNIPELAGAAVVGALGGKYGFEGMMAGVAPRMGGRLASGAIGVADEATQGAVEQLASNIGVRRVLPSQSLTEDIGLNAAAEGILGVGGFARPIRAIGSAKSTDEAIAAADQALTASTAEAKASLDAATLDPAIAAYDDLINQQRQVRDANQQALLGDEEYRPGAVQPASGFANRFPPEPPRALTYHPTAGQLVVFPDGSAMTRTEYEQRKAQQEQSRLDGMVQDAPLPGMMQRAVEQSAPVADAMELNALVRDERADKSARLKAEIERLQAKNKPADVPSAQTATAPSQGEASPIQDSATVPAQTRANSSNSPATNALQQQYDAAKAAGDTATMRLLAPQINAEKQRNTQATAERQKPAVAFAIGQTPANAEPITVRNGVVYQGEYALEDYETGQPVTVPEGATHAQIRKAMEDAGQVPKGFKFFGEVKAVVQPVAADAPAQTVPVTEVPQTPAVRSIPLGRRKSPIMRRDDLVGAIMRVTGGDGIAANLAQTITGDTANNVTKLRGLFANNGNGDLDDVAMLLRVQEGYDIRDGNHLSELISEAATGNMTYSMERTERERANAADAEYRERINARASELGLKKIGGRRTLAIVEADIAREERRLSDLEAQAEREAIVASDAIDDAIGSDMTEADWMAWVSDGISGAYTQEDIDRAEENRANRENARAKALAYDYAEGQAQGGSRQGNGDSQAAAEGGGTETGARGAAEGLTLTGQTNAEAAAEFKRQQEEANRQDKETPAKNVTADQVDLFNTQGGLFNSNREAPKAEAPAQADKGVRLYSQTRNRLASDETTLAELEALSGEQATEESQDDTPAQVRDLSVPESAEIADLLGENLPEGGKAGIIADIRTLPSAAEATGTRMSRKTAEAIRFVAGIFGRKVVFYEATHKTPEGMNLDGKTLYVNVDGDVDALAVAGHEFVHSLEHTDPEAYQAALDAVKGILEADPARAESYAAYYGKQDMDADALAKELLSDIGGNLWRDESFFGEVFAEVQRQHPHAEARSIITRLRDALVAFINKLIAASPKQGFQLEEKGLITREELESIKARIVKMAANAFIAEEKARAGGETMYQPGRAGEVRGDVKLSQARLEKALGPVRNLVTLHNLSESNLLHAKKMGGIAVPSLAVTKKNAPITGFGEITLIAPKAMIDPKGYAGTKVYGADIYSPRYPQVSYKLSSSAMGRLNEMLAGYRNEGERPIYGGDIDRADDLTSNAAFKRYADEKVGDTASWSQLKSLASEMLSDAGAEERILQGYSNSGNRRYTPHTLESVVKILKKELRGGEGFNYGTGSVRAKFTPQFKSIAQIQKAKDRLVSKADFEKIKSEIDDELMSVAEALQPFHPASNRFGFLDTVTMAMGDSAKMGVSRALEENGFEDVPPEAQQEFVEFVNKLRNLPTEYFEAKILRDVDVAEFVGAVVPEGTSQKAIDYLKERGINDIAEYKYGDDADRAAKVEELATKIHEEKKEVLFSPARLAEAWEKVAENSAVFRYPKSNSKDLATIIDTVLPGATIKQYDNILDYEQAWEVHLPKGGKAYVLLFPDGNVELNSKQIGEGNDGSAMYAAVGNWAFNTGKVFNGDRLGIEGPGVERRIQNLISLALKFKSTDFIGLGKEVEDRLGTKLIPGEFRRNLGVLLQESYDHVALNFPEIENVRYNFDTGRFSPPIDAGMVERAREAGVRGGKGTLAVAAFSNSVLVSGRLPEGWKPGSVSNGDTGRNELAGALYSTQRQTGQDVTDNATPQGGVSLSTVRVQTDTPEFRAWFGESKVVDNSLANLLSEPNGPGILLDDLLSAQDSSGPSLNPVQALMLALTKNDKIGRGIVGLIPVDVMNSIAKDSGWPENRRSDTSMLIDAINAPVPDQVLSALRGVLTSLSAKLADAISTGSNQEIAPALLASDFNLREMGALLSLHSRTDFWGGNSGVESIGASKTAKPSSAGFGSPAKNLKLSPTALADLLNKFISFAPHSKSSIKDDLPSAKYIAKQGRPLVVYHGTTSSFDSFDPAKQGEKDHGWYGIGHYLTADPETASAYSVYDEMKDGSPTPGANVMPLFVSLKNPYVWPKDRKAAQNRGEAEQITKELIAAGHDGVVVPNEYQAPEYAGFHEVIAFRPEQIKSAIGNNGQFDGNNPDIRYSTQRVQQGEAGKPFTLEVTPQGGQRFRDGVTAIDEDDAIRFANFLWPDADVRVLAQKTFIPDLRYSLPRQTQWYYSQLSRAVENAPDKVFGPAKQVALWLQSNKAKLGIKDDELQWTGVLDWLGTQGKVSKAEVLAYLDANGMQVQEVMKGAGIADLPEGWTIEQDKYGNWQVLNDKNVPVTTPQRSRDSALSAMPKTASPTKFDRPDLVLPGGENYRELLLTLPEVKTSKPFEQWTKENFDGSDTEHARKIYAMQQEPGKNFTSSHWDEPNVIAHVRYNDRTDADGNKVLFLEELQGDWQQEYRKQSDLIADAVDKDFLGIVKRMEADGILEVNCD